MDNEDQLLKDLEEFKQQFPNYPDPQTYPQQFNYYVKLFYFYKNRKEKNAANLVVT